MKQRLDLTPVPILRNESLYVGIDVGKYQHVAGFVSTTLLERHERFEGCPVLIFEQSRQGFRSLIERIRSYVRATVSLPAANENFRSLIERIRSYVPLEQVYV